MSSPPLFPIYKHCGYPGVEAISKIRTYRRNIGNFSELIILKCKARCNHGFRLNLLINLDARDFLEANSGKSTSFCAIVRKAKIFHVIQLNNVLKLRKDSSYNKPGPAEAGRLGETSTSPLLSEIHYFSRFPSEI